MNDLHPDIQCMTECHNWTLTKLNLYPSSVQPQERVGISWSLAEAELDIRVEGMHQRVVATGNLIQEPGH